MSSSAFGADSSYDGGQPTHPKDLKGKKIVLADVPKLIGIGYFAATTKGEAEAATELTKNGLPTEVTTDAPTEAAIQKQIEYIDNDISRGMDGILFAANDLSAISPVLRKALKAGVHVIGYDAESQPDAREWFIQQATPEGIAKALIDHSPCRRGPDCGQGASGCGLYGESERVESIENSAPALD